MLWYAYTPIVQETLVGGLPVVLCAPAKTWLSVMNISLCLSTPCAQHNDETERPRVPGPAAKILNEGQINTSIQFAIDFEEGASNTEKGLKIESAFLSNGVALHYIHSLIFHPIIFPVILRIYLLFFFFSSVVAGPAQLSGDVNKINRNTNDSRYAPERRL